ncbi:DNA-binding protein Alba [Candidatus Woesearchaeota archaeon]|nr:DNA-binding protein Alba [Candidatus Woesearchaeota archaeon]
MESDHTEKQEDNTEQKRDFGNNNSIFIGGKPFMNYVTGVVMQFTTKSADEVIIKARGKFISRAVDVAEVAAKRFLDGTVGITDIKVDSEGFKNNEGKDVRVSTIEITLGKNQ